MRTRGQNLCTKVFAITGKNRTIAWTLSGLWILLYRKGGEKLVKSSS